MIPTPLKAEEIEFFGLHHLFSLYSTFNHNFSNLIQKFNSPSIANSSINEHNFEQEKSINWHADLAEYFRKSDPPKDWFKSDSSSNANFTAKDYGDLEIDQKILKFWCTHWAFQADVAHLSAYSLVQTFADIQQLKKDLSRLKRELFIARLKRFIFFIGPYLNKAFYHEKKCWIEQQAILLNQLHRTCLYAMLFKLQAAANIKDPKFGNAVFLTARYATQLGRLPENYSSKLSYSIEINADLFLAMHQYISQYPSEINLALKSTWYWFQSSNPLIIPTLATKNTAYPIPRHPVLEIFSKHLLLQATVFWIANINACVLKVYELLKHNYLEHIEIQKLIDYLEQAQTEIHQLYAWIEIKQPKGIRKLVHWFNMIVTKCFIALLEDSKSTRLFKLYLLVLQKLIKELKNHIESKRDLNVYKLSIESIINKMICIKTRNQSDMQLFLQQRKLAYHLIATIEERAKILLLKRTENKIISFLKEANFDAVEREICSLNNEPEMNDYLVALNHYNNLIDNLRKLEQGQLALENFDCDSKINNVDLITFIEARYHYLAQQNTNSKSLVLLLKLLRSLKPDHLQYDISYFGLLNDNEDLQEKINVLKRLFKKTNSFDYLNQLMILSMHHKNWKAILDHLDQYTEIISKKEKSLRNHLFYNLAEKLMEHENYPLLTQLCFPFKAKIKDFYQADYFLGLIHLKQNDKQQVIIILNELQKNAADLAALLKAQYYLTIDDYHQAMKCVEQAIKQPIPHPHAYLLKMEIEKKLLFSAYTH